MAASDTFTIPVQCPKCEKKFEKRLADLRADAQFECPACGTGFVVSGDEFQKARKAIADLGKQIAGLSRTLKIKL